MAQFAPQGLTVNAAVTGTVATLTLTPLGIAGGNVRLTNIGSQTVFILIDNATVATVVNAMPLLPNTTEVFAVGTNSAVQHIAAAVGSTLYATSGLGE